MSEQHRSIGDRCEIDALGEIGPAQFRLFLAHSSLLDADAVRIRFYCALGNTGIRAADLRGSLSSDPSNAVIRQELFLIRSVDRDARVIRRTVFDPLTVDIDVHEPARPIDLSHRIRRDQHPLSGPPIPGVHFDVTDVPASIVHEEILDMTDPTVACVDLIPCHSRDATKMRVAVVELRIGTTSMTRFYSERCYERYRHPTFHWDIAATP